jgi:hypothetical protein
MQANNQVQPAFVAYQQMVENLFKKLETDELTLHHATTGMAGETAEILDLFRLWRNKPLHTLAGADLDNFALELGDWRFYTQKVWNIYGWEYDSFVLPMPGSTGGLTFAVENVIIHSGAILDLSKKAWIYGKEVDARDLLEQMEGAMAAYQDVLFFMGFSDDHICKRNAEKLAIRFPDGVYSNADAIARADKADEFQPGTVADKIISIADALSGGASA